MADRIQMRRDTAANWTAANPVLAQGEPGIETDTLKIKIGDGATAWTSLAYGLLGAVGPQGPQGPQGPEGPMGSVTYATVAEAQAGTSTTTSMNPAVLHDSMAAAKVGTATAGECDLATGCIFDVTVNGATTISVVNAPVGRDALFLLRVTNGGSATVTWPSGITWPGGTAPTLTAAGVDYAWLLRTSAGAWAGNVSKDVK